MADLIADLVSVASLGIAAAALYKSSQTDRRDREAIIIVRPMWDRMGDDEIWRTTAPATLPPQRPIVPDLRFVIATKSRKLIDGLILRKNESGDDRNHDTPHSVSHLRLIEVLNAGHSAAIKLRLGVVLSCSFSVQGVDHESVDAQSISLDGLAPGAARFVEIRCLIGAPVTLHFESVTAGVDGKQPAKIDARDVTFNPRVAWGLG